MTRLLRGMGVEKLTVPAASAHRHAPTRYRGNLTIIVSRATIV